MDPDRVRAYLQVACAGLGFDIGEIWWTQSDESSSALAAIGEFSFENAHPPFFWGLGFDRIHYINRPDRTFPILKIKGLALYDLTI